jgi:DNA-binding HxlR family transcriptional regulator
MPKKPGKAVRGSTSGRPIMVLFDILGQRWTLRILWELRESRCTFRELQQRCGEISPTILNRRLKDLRTLHILDHDKQGYGLTQSGQDLGARLMELNAWSQRWAATLENEAA